MIPPLYEPPFSLSYPISKFYFVYILWHDLFAKSYSGVSITQCISQIQKIYITITQVYLQQISQEIHQQTNHAAHQRFVSHKYQQGYPMDTTGSLGFLLLSGSPGENKEKILKEKYAQSFVWPTSPMDHMSAVHSELL